MKQEKTHRDRAVGHLLGSLVGTPGFEPGTSCAPCKHATRLRHVPMLLLMVPCIGPTGKPVPGNVSKRTRTGRPANRGRRSATV